MKMANTVLKKNVVKAWSWFYLRRLRVGAGLCGAWLLAPEQLRRLRFPVSAGGGETGVPGNCTPDCRQPEVWPVEGGEETL